MCNTLIQLVYWIMKPDNASDHQTSDSESREINFPGSSTIDEEDEGAYTVCC